MRLLFITDSNLTGASFRYRVHQYLSLLEAEGFECEVARARTLPLRRLSRLREFDVVFVQKKLFSVPWILAASHSARSMIFDFDDAIWTCPKRDWSPITRLKVTSRLRTMLSKCTCVTVGNSYLADYANKYNPRATVIPTCIDTDHYRPLSRLRTDDIARIGWIGSRPNLGYLESLEPVFERLSATCKASLIVVANKGYQSSSLPTEFVQWSLDGELDALRRIDIGIMPLPDDEWTRGKCGFKTIQYMACGIPAVSSRVGFNTEFVQDGWNGFLATDEEDWTKKIASLVADEGLRQHIGKEGRRTVEEKYSLGVGKALLTKVIESAGSSG